tara:strand:- start:217 stop:390 length:174 start_codon:yes stop_codon:yes gene_type:complete
MTSQYSTACRKHPGYETALDRDRDRASAELCAYLAKADAMRERLRKARVIEPAETVH